MSFGVFILILVSAILHAGWNFLSKKCVPSAAFYFLSSLTAAVLWMPFLLFSSVHLDMLPARFWVLLMLSGVAECVYMIALAHAYRCSDISLAYPLVRALPVLMTATLTALLGLGTPLGTLAFFGMILISAGCFLMPFHSLRSIQWKTLFNRAFLFILLAACGVTAYTIVDSRTVKVAAAASGAGRIAVSLFLIGMIELTIVIFLGIYVWRNQFERRELKRLLGKTALPHLSGAASSLAYTLILFAMGMVSNVSYVQAFRQMSLPLGVFAGIFLLREKCGPLRLAGIGLVVTGLILAALG